jgi:zinc protease
MHTLRYSLILLSFAGLLVPLHGVSAQQTSGVSVMESLPLRVPDVRTDSLSNGLKLFFVHVNDLPLVEISFLFDAGIAKDPSAGKGVAQMTNEFLMMGTKKRSREEVLSNLNLYGSTVANYTHYEYAQLYGRCLARNFQQTLDIMAEILITPAMDEGVFGVMKHDIGVSLTDYSPSIAERSTMELLGLLFGTGHLITNGLVKPLLNADSVLLSEVNRFYSDWYTPNNAALLIVGNINPAIAKTMIAERLGEWKRKQNPAGTTEAVAMKSDTATVIVDDAASKIAWVRIGAQHGIERRSGDFYPLLVLNHILGESASSRLKKALWLDRPISPTISSGISFFGNGGYIVVSGTTSPQYCDSVHLYTRDVFALLAASPVPMDELRAAQNELYLDYITCFATNSSVQTLMKEMVVSHLSSNAMKEYVDGIMRVTPEAVQKVAGKIFAPSGLCEVYAGNAEVILPVLHGADVKLIKVIYPNRTQE